MSIIGALDAATWRALLDDVDEPTPDAIAELLAGQFDLTHAHARDELADAATDPSTPIALDAGETIVVDDGDDAGGGDELESDADRSDDATTSATGGRRAVARSSGREFHPDGLVARDWWVNWVLAYRHDDEERDGKPTKQPVAPYDRGDARPVAWNFDLPDDEHPCTSFDRVRPWSGMSTTMDLTAPERVVSDVVDIGIILPRGQGDDTGGDRTVLLIDWDDVRDPDTEEIHPVVARALDGCDGYAEISQSGKGIHQFVYGEIPGPFRKFIRHIDDEPFIGDDLPAVEIYQSGRLCAMTGEHVADSGEDIVDGQDMVDRLCWKFGASDNAAPGTPDRPVRRGARRRE